MLDPSILFDNNPDEPLYFERNTLIFSIFLSRPYDTKEERVAALQEFENYLSADLRPYIEYYPWYYKPVQFRVVPNFSGHSFIYGELEYGDYMPDLWLLTSVLFGFSSRDPDLYIRVFDQDGEFLLIEGDSQIPAWLSGEKAASNRVWINDQSIKTIPFDFRTGGSISMEESLKFISKKAFKVAKLVDLTKCLADKLQTTAIVESLQNTFEEEVFVSEKMFKLIARNKFFLSNAALNYHLEQGLPDIYKLGGKSLGDDYYVDGTHSSVVLHIRVSLLAHIYLRKYGGDARKNGQILAHLVDSFLAENSAIEDIKTDVEVFKGGVDVYNKSVDEDPLQRELLRFNVIDKHVEPVELDIDDIKSPTDIKVNDPEEMLNKIKKFVNEDEEDEVNNEANADSDGEETDEQIKRRFKEEGVNIDEDDFFEFFCKEALHLKPEDLENMRQFSEKEMTSSDGNKEVPHTDDNARDVDDKDMDIEMLTNLLQSLKAEDGSSGPVSSLLRQFSAEK